MNQVDGSTPDAGSTPLDATTSPAKPDAELSADSAAAEPDAGLEGIDASSGEPDAGPSADQLLSTALQNKLRNECGLFSAGALNDELFAVRDQYERCVATCYVNGACTDMKAMFCDAKKNAVAQCAEACNPAPADGFLCNDGSRIAHAYVCDLGMSKNCPDNSDEQNCGDPFTCGSGAKIPRKLVCDLIAICSDDSDEKQSCAVVKCE